MTTPAPAYGLAFDLETTGFCATKNEAIQVAAKLVKLAPGLPTVGTFSSLMRPERPETASTQALAVHGYTLEELARAPRAAYVWKMLYNFARMAPGPLLIIGHNVAFDLRFLEEAERLHGFKIDRQAGEPFDTCNAARIHLLAHGLIASAKLGSVGDYYGISFKAHDAVGDVDACLEIARRIGEEDPALYRRGLAGSMIGGLLDDAMAQGYPIGSFAASYRDKGELHHTAIARLTKAAKYPAPPLPEGVRRPGEIARVPGGAAAVIASRQEVTA